MGKKRRRKIECTRMELEGVRYVIVREAVFERLCTQAGVSAAPGGEADSDLSSSLEVDGVTLADKLIRRRRATGLTQAELARRAGVRCETLNRIERGRTTPDFATVRKLIVAINAAEAESATR